MQRQNHPRMQTLTFPLHPLKLKPYDDRIKINILTEVCKFKTTVEGTVHIVNEVYEEGTVHSPS